MSSRYRDCRFNSKFPNGVSFSVTEGEFFLHLEMRICRELQELRDKSLRHYWCDGFIPDPDFLILDNRPQLNGRVWIAAGRGSQCCWDFTLLVGYDVRNRHSIQWQWLMPDKNLTGWLTMDFEKKQIRIEPPAAYPDRSSLPE